MQTIFLPRSMPLASVQGTTQALKLSRALAAKATAYHAQGKTALGVVYDVRARAALHNAMQSLPTNGN